MLLVDNAEFMNFFLELWHIGLKRIFDFLVLTRSEFRLFLYRFFERLELLVNKFRKSGLLLFSFGCLFYEEFVGFRRQHADFFFAYLVQLNLKRFILVDLLVENIQLILDVIKLGLKDALGLEDSVIDC